MTILKTAAREPNMYRAVPVSALFDSIGYPNLCTLNSVPLTHSYRKKSGSRQGYSPPRTAECSARGKRDAST